MTEVAGSIYSLFIDGKRGMGEAQRGRSLKGATSTEYRAHVTTSHGVSGLLLEVDVFVRMAYNILNVRYLVLFEPGTWYVVCKKRSMRQNIYQLI